MDLREQLELFVRRAEELRDMRLLRNNDLQARINLNWHHVEGGRIEVSNPDEEDLRSYLLTFRQFISDKEPVFLNRIYNLCQQHLTSQELKQNLIEARQHWKDIQKGKGIEIVFDERRMTPERVTDLWINGWYFHNDDAMRKELLSLVPVANMLVRWRFLDYVVDATRQVLYVAHVVKASLQEGYFDFS